MDTNNQFTAMAREEKFSRPKNYLSFMFDMVRAIMYLGIGGFAFSTHKYDDILGRSFIVGFAAVAIIYGVFRLIRALMTIRVIKFM
jgi:hypothetical protein